MRRLLAGAAGAALLTATVLATPATAAVAKVRVDGNHFTASGLRPVSQGCTDPALKPGTAPSVVIAKGPGTPPLGSRSIGWNNKVSEFASGVAARVAHPTTTTLVRARVYTPSAVGSGISVAWYYAPNDTGVWRGESPVKSDGVRGWHTVDASSYTYAWSHYTSSGTRDQVDSSATLAGFAASHGGDGDGAYVGLAYGCDGNDFYLDALQVGSSAASRTFDFEGYATKAQLATGGTAPKKITIIAGKTVALTAELRKAFDNKAFGGQLKIVSRELSAKTWHAVASPKVGTSGYDFTARPFVSSAFKVSYAGTTAYEPSAKTLTILVRPYVSAGFVHSTVTKGHSFTLRGRILPARHAAIKLQHWTGSRWDTIKKGATGSDGRYSMSAVSSRLGKSYWRITVAAGGGNISGKSPWKKLKTAAPPAPSGGGGGTTPTPTSPPPPPPDAPPPPPPPTH